MHCGLVVLFLLEVKINVWSRYEWMHEGQGVPRARTRGRGGLSWSEEEMGLMMVAVRLHGPLWPFSCPMIQYHWPDQSWQNSQLRLLWQQVPNGRWANSYGIKYSPSHRRQSVCPLLLYIPPPATSPPACTYWNDLWKWLLVLCRLIKTPCMEQMM